MLKRYPDWPERLSRYLASVKARPFVWGEHDCCLFAADALLAMTGIDTAARWRNRYSTSIGAGRVLKLEGFDSLEAAITDAIGQSEPNLMLASRGDVALVRNAGNPAAGIVFGRGVYVPGESGLLCLSRDTIIHLWRV